MSTPPHPPLRVERRGNAQFIVLDRPRARNALTSDVIERLHRAYAAGEDNATLCAHVILGANSGTFCAGGDVRAVREMVLKNERDAAVGFFSREFALNARLATLTKPSACVWNGSVMGGGAGLSCYAPVRVSTEKTVFAMPECAIGLWPDVGASWFLRRLCGGATGTWLALTGARVRGKACKALGLSTHHVTCESWDAVCEPMVRALTVGASAEDLAACAAAGETSADAAEDGYDEYATTARGKRAIEEIFGDESLSLSGITSEIARRRDAATDDVERRFFAESAESLAKACPTSLEVTLELMRRARGKSLEWSLATDNALISQFIFADDFKRGVDAVLITKVGVPPPEGWAPTRSPASFFSRL
jgi:enoyl-CoA hydratase/carnithine racemase